jgi:valyl-tRNA synthetase
VTFRAVIAKVEELRNARSSWGIGPKETLRLEVPAALLAAASDLVEAIATLVRGEVAPYGGTDGSLRDQIAGVRGVADAAKLRERYTKDLTRLEAEIARAEKKLANPGFVERAAPDVVAAEREKLDSYRRDHDRVHAALAEV